MYMYCDKPQILLLEASGIYMYFAILMSAVPVTGQMAQDTTSTMTSNLA